jgi:hypothetical protein
LPTLIEEINKLAGIDDPVTPELIESIGGLPGRNPNGDRVIEGDTEVDTERFIVGHQSLPIFTGVSNAAHVPAGRSHRRE